MEELLEREGELETLRAMVDEARLGRGGTVVVEGAAGSGKTALLRVLREEASDVRVLRAVGGELEREFPFGVVRQLFEREVHASSPSRRSQLLAGAAAHAAPVVGAAPEPVADASFATLHGLYWLAAALADETPLLLVVDDAHWCDAPSLRFLVFLARRAVELPLLVCVGARVNEPGAEVELLAALGEAPGAVVVRPSPLSAAGVRALFGPVVPDDAVATAIETTGGNPLLLHELVRSLAGGEVTAAAVRAAVPSSVTRSVQRRLGRLDASARSAARALAVLGDASLLSGDVDDALRALRELELVEDDPPRFVHPLVRAAVAEPVLAAERDALHHSAARTLRERRGAEEDIVLHLLAAPPIGESWAVEVLRSAARRAAAEGAPDAAVRRLARSLEELGREDDSLRLELGLTAARAGDPDARSHLELAARSVDPAIAAQAIEAIRVTPGDDLEAAAATLRGALDRLPPGELRERITGQLLNTLMQDLRLAPRRAATLAELAGAEHRPPDGGTPAPDADTPPRHTTPALATPDRGVLAHRTYDAAAGDATADEVLALAARALDGRPFTRLEAIERPTLFWVVVALIAADGAALADAALLDAEATARRYRTRLGGAFVAFLRAEWELAFGSPAKAEAEARAATEVFVGANTVALGAAAALVRALLLLGRVDEAAQLVDELPGDDQLAHGWGATLVWNARADLQLARGQDALADLDRIESVTSAFGWRRMVPGHNAGRRARALLAAGRHPEAVAAAETEAAEAQRRGVATYAAQALAVLGELDARAGSDGRARAQAAVEVAERSPSPRARAEAAFALGLSLRRDGARTDARRHLEQARDLAARYDLTALAARAAEELVVAGGKPKRAALAGAAALTPSERRMAEHAARGLSNREIAETLFVTRKTVEFTLGNAYSKLGIRSRTQLTDALG